jgi:hypothetical protein
VDHSRVERLRQRLADVHSDCRSCELANRCTHRCGCINVATSGVLGAPSPTACHMEQLLIRDADRVAASLNEERCASFMAKF